MASLFISHTHGDKFIADALARLVEILFKTKVAAKYSSSPELDGGIAPGEDWFSWILTQVKQADLAFIVLTASSIQKPWVLWEAGAVAGVAYATKEGGRRVCPIAFGLKAGEIPSPFAHLQIVNGTDRAEMTKLSKDLFRQFSPSLTDDEKADFGERRPIALSEYLESVEKRLRTLPLPVTEALVQEWLERIATLEKADRPSETSVLDDWIDIAFGRRDEGRTRPIDVRLHRRLGDLYSRAGRASDAVKQFMLARELAPRDLFVLRSLGKAYLDSNDQNAARQVLEDIELLDTRAFERTPETTALKARWCETNGDLAGAIAVLRVGYNYNPTYYIGDRLGQLLLRQGAHDEAKKVYRRVRETVGGLSEQNVWTSTTALAAALVLGDEARRDELIGQFKRMKLTKEQRASITRGLSVVAHAVGGDAPNLLGHLLGA